MSKHPPPPPPRLGAPSSQPAARRPLPAAPRSAAPQERVQFPAYSHLSGRRGAAERQRGSAPGAGRGAALPRGSRAPAEPRKLAQPTGFPFQRKWGPAAPPPCREGRDQTRGPAACGTGPGPPFGCRSRPREAGAGQPRAPSAGRVPNCGPRARDHTHRWPGLRPCARPQLEPAAACGPSAREYPLGGQVELLSSHSCHSHSLSLAA